MIKKNFSAFELSHEMSKAIAEMGFEEATPIQSLAIPIVAGAGHQDSLEIEGQQKAPDYTFRVGTLPKFYAEAKKCGVNINADPGPAYQLRRYGWSAKVPLSILTDFEEIGRLRLLAPAAASGQGQLRPHPLFPF